MLWNNDKMEETSTSVIVIPGLVKWLYFGAIFLPQFAARPPTKRVVEGESDSQNISF
jgi:hypothetical protein